MRTPPTHRPWFGRELALEGLRARLERVETLVVTGPPGVGKSRLAAELAATWVGPVVWCDLAEIGEPDEVAARMSAGLGPFDGAEGPADALVVLDDADAASPALPDLLAASWRRPGTTWRCVVTTRTRLDHRFENFVVEPLDPSASLALFLDRVRGCVPGGSDLSPERVGPLLAHLEGLPLAIELAAAGARVVPPGRWADDLVRYVARASSTDRWRSVAAAVAASFDALPPSHQGALVAAGAFHGPFDAAQFEQVADAPVWVLEDLLDASLVHGVEVGWFRLLAPIRRFVQDLPAPDELPAKFAAAVVAAADRALVVARGGGGWSGLDRHRADLEAVCSTGPGAAAAEAALRLAELHDALGPLRDPTAGLVPPPHLVVAFAAVRARVFIRNRAFAEAEVALDVAAGTPTEEVALCTARIELLLQRNQVAQAQQVGVTLVDALARVCDPRLVAEANLVLAGLDLLAGQPEAAIERLERVVEGDDRVLAGIAIAHLGLVRAKVDPARAATSYAHAVELFASIGVPRWEGTVRRWLGILQSSVGDLECARSELERAAEIARSAGDVIEEGLSAARLAGVHLVGGRPDLARAEVERVRGDAPPGSSIEAMITGAAGWVALHGGDDDAAAACFRAAHRTLDRLSLHSGAGAFRLFVAVAIRDAPERASVELAAGRATPGVPAPLVALAAHVVEHGDLPKGWREAAGSCFLARVLGASLDRGPAALVVDGDGEWFSVSGARFELKRKPVLRRLLRALARHGGAPVSRDALVNEVWPNDRSRRASLYGRLHVALCALRKLGLGGWVMTTRVGSDVAYALHPSVERALPERPERPEPSERVG